MQMVIRTINLGRKYWRYKKVRKTLEILAIASVIGSAFTSDIVGSDYIDGAVQLELPFNKHPLLGWMPNMEFSYKNTTVGRVIELDFSYEKKDPYGEGWNNLGLVGAINVTYNIDAGTFAGSAVGVGFSYKFYKKGPVELSVKLKGELPRALKFGLGAKFSSGWDPLSLGVGLSIFQWTPSGFEMLWGINWND